MASRKICTRKRGFTLIETLIVLGTVAFLISLSLFFDMNSYRGAALRAEESTIVIALQTARADSLNNVHQSPHGVALYPADHPNSYVIFEGQSYAGRVIERDVVLDAGYFVQLTQTSPLEVDFEQLTGNAMVGGANYDGDIGLVDPARQMNVSIHINHEGGISW